MAQRYSEWFADPLYAPRWVAQGRTWAVVNEFTRTPVETTYERAIVYLAGGWLQQPRRRVKLDPALPGSRLAHLTERRAPDGSRYWEWVPIDDPGAMPSVDPEPALDLPIH